MRRHIGKRLGWTSEASGDGGPEQKATSSGQQE